ncbi:MAG: cysteine--tRNA ligase [Candidatus Omnitrophica bacterium]|nr:cysteine--tRNA ligase [Candidatus Omnitrophota bacterium]
MPIYVYNSLTRKKEEFIPLNPPEVKIYVCGPTVYDEPHIGHARSVYVFEVIRRYLVYKGYKVKFVRNITDVDDKIIEKARKEYPQEDLNISFRKVADKYLRLYQEALSKLGIDSPQIIEPKASEYIDKMINFIQALIDKGAAYVAGRDVYFDIKKAKDYGKLSHQSLEKMEAGARIDPQENKKDPLDFALWKGTKEDEPSWDSPWGKGRPGWHIECSVMSSDILGDEFDIHGGGLDLIFPHHENEIAQSQARGLKFVRIWMHHGLLTIHGQKMAKSLGNFVSIKDFLDKYRYADLLKLFFLSAHYSSPLDYREEKIEETKEALERILILMEKIDRKLSSTRYQVSDKKISEIEEIKAEFIQAMDDDFNTPKAVASIFELVNLANKNIQNLDFIYNTKALIKELLDIFAISLKAEASFEISDEEIKAKIAARQKARHNKDYTLADRIRQELERKGIILEDTKDGTTWRRKL